MADSPGGATDEQATLDLFHRTSHTAAELIAVEKAMISKENTAEVYFSTNRLGQAEGYGEAVVHVRVPVEIAELEDEFPNGEQHYRVKASALLTDWVPGRVNLGLWRNWIALRLPMPTVPGSTPGRPTIFGFTPRARGAMDSAPDSGSGGWRFESSRAHARTLHIWRATPLW